MDRAARRQLVEWGQRELPISLQAQLLGLNRTALYYQPMPPSPEEIALKHRIDELYTAHPYYGYRRITAQLQREGKPINHKAVARHCSRSQSEQTCPPGGHLSVSAREYHRQRNAPNQIWGLDITYIRLRGGWMYLVAVLDWYSRYVVSWELDQTMWVAFVIEALQQALAQAVPQICNSDQGSQFTSPQYTQLLLSHGVRISMDSKGRALDNIFTERLWRSVKYEEVYLQDYATPREAREGLTKYLRFYNEERLHQALDYLTPAEVYFEKSGKESTPE